MNLKRRIRFGHYLVCILAVGGATGLTLCINALRDIHSLSLFLVAVVISAFYGGLYPSILAIVLSALCFDYFIAPPAGWGISSPQDRIRLLSFVAVAFFFSLLHGQREKAEDKLRSMAQRLTLALEGTKLGVWDLDLDTGVVWHSAGLEEPFGAPRTVLPAPTKSFWVMCTPKTAILYTAPSCEPPKRGRNITSNIASPSRAEKPAGSPPGEECSWIPRAIPTPGGSNHRHHQPARGSPTPVSAVANPRFAGF